MDEAISEFVQNLIQAWNKHDIQAVTAFYAPDYIGLDVGEAKPQKGPEAVRKSLALYLSAFPDLHLREIETVIQNPHIAVRWIARGTHQGALMNIPPTGREITFCGSSFFTLMDGKITHAQTIWDVAGVLREIGLLPEL